MKYLSLVTILLALSASASAASKDAAKPKAKPNQWSKMAENRSPSSTKEHKLVSRACDGSTPTDLAYFVEKKDFAQGAVRVFSVDTYGEPACCSTHMVIYFPNEEGLGDKCFHIASSADGLGFSGTNLKNIKASNDPKKGLSLKLPVLFYNQEPKSPSDMTITKNFEIRIDRKAQTVQVK